MFIVPICATVTSGCMSTPPLSEATGEERSPIMIKDVVQRVKCEISDAFDKKVEQPEFLWLADWTAHIDLALTINDNAGVSPNGTYTSYRPSAVNYDAGPSSFPVTAQNILNRSLVPQFFTLSAGANASGQAVRTETVSFTVALDELKLWREQLDKREAHFAPEKKTCYYGTSTGVQGNLGLQEWVDSAFFPAEIGELQAGIHPSQGSGKAGTTQGPKQAPAAGGLKSLEAPSKEQILHDTAKWKQDLADLQATTKQSNAQIVDATTKINTADADLKNKLQIYKDSKFDRVLAPYLKQRYNFLKANLDKYIKTHSDNEKNCAALQGNIDKALKSVSDITDEAKQQSEPDASLIENYSNLKKLMAAIGSDNYPEKSTACAKELSLEASQAAQNANALPNQIDPPIDSVLHSVQFVVSYGAGISPSWTLLQWKGPGQSQNLVSASGVRTHNLQIAIGPRTGNPAISGDALRLINNQTIRSLSN